MTLGKDQKADSADGQLRTRARDFLRRSAQGIRRRLREQFAEPDHVVEVSERPTSGSSTVKRLRPLKPECTMQHISTNSSIIGNGAGPSSARCTEDCPFPCPLTYTPRSSRTNSKEAGTAKSSCQDSGVDVKMRPTSPGELEPSAEDTADNNTSSPTGRWARKPPSPYTAITIPLLPPPTPGPFTPRSPLPSPPSSLLIPLSPHGVPSLTSFFSQISLYSNTDRIHYIDELHQLAPQPEECAQALGDFYSQDEGVMPVRRSSEIKRERGRIAEVGARMEGQEGFVRGTFGGWEMRGRSGGQDGGQRRGAVVGPRGEVVGFDEEDGGEQECQGLGEGGSAQHVEEHIKQTVSEAANAGQQDLRQPLLDPASERNGRADVHIPHNAKKGTCEEKTLWGRKARQEFKLKLWEAGLYKRGEKHYNDQGKEREGHLTGG